MIPARRDVTVVQGATWRFTAFFPFRLDGAQVMARLTPGSRGKEPVELTEANGRVAVDRSVNAAPQITKPETAARSPWWTRVTLSLSAQETGALSWTVGTWDLEIIAASGSTDRYFDGRVSVRPRGGVK